jgi:hypothetical protein
MKILILSIFLTFSLISLAQNDDYFGSAEEKIVYNKNNGLNKYAGINISYTYELHLKSEIPKESLEKIGNHFFNHLVDIQIFESDNKKYISYLTEGSQRNNNISREIPAKLNSEFIFSKRTYHLK